VESQDETKTINSTLPDVMQLVKSISKLTQGSHYASTSSRDLIPAFSALAQDIVDAKVEDLKRNVSEAMNASHSLYSVTFVLIVAIAFGSICLFMITLV
jgi:hypothetical protein